MNEAPLLVPRAAGDQSALSTVDLFKEIANKASLLVRKEVELARAEVKSDVKREISTAKGLGIAGIAALVTAANLCLTLALLLDKWLPGWGAGLIVTGATLVVAAIGGIYGWQKHVRKPLGTTLQSLQEDVRWTREKLA